MSETSYITEELIAGKIQTDQVKLKADTYYRGMPLKYTAASDYYEYSATGSEISAIFMEDESRVLAAAGYGSVIVGGEVFEGGFVDDSGDALTLDDDYKAAASVRGFYIKRT